MVVDASGGVIHSNESPFLGNVVTDVTVAAVAIVVRHAASRDPAQAAAITRMCLSIGEDEPRAALLQSGLPAPQSIEITDGNYLVATFEIDDAALALMAAAGIRSPKEFASKAVITVRNAALPFKVVDAYRVTLNGPPPGPGLITRYGTARCLEGSSVTWEPGPPNGFGAR